MSELWIKQGSLKMMGSQPDYSRGRPGSEEIGSLKMVDSQADCIQVGRPGSEEILRQEQSWWELKVTVALVSHGTKT